MTGPVYLALDFPDWQQTETFLNRHNLQGVPVKVGMELFYKEGPALIEKLKTAGHLVFLDLKLHDIPTTVQHAMRNIARLGADVVNVHALGGSTMMQAAKEGLLQGSGQRQVPRLLAVTLLTSMNETTLKKELGISFSLEETVVRLARLSKDSGSDGVVCSVQEARAVKAECGGSFQAVTPGIRLAGTEHNDQKRIATPATARKNDVDAIVVGRSITQAENPARVYQQVVKEWENGKK